MEKIAILDQRLLGESIPPAAKGPPGGTFTLLLCDLEDQIRAAAEAGYDGVGLSSYDIERYLRQNHSSEEMVSLLDKYRIPVSQISCIVEWHYEGEARKKAMEEMRRISAYASLLGCDMLDVELSPYEGNISLAKRDFGEICKMAADYGLGVALGFTGFGIQVNDIKKARIVVEEPTNGGISLDTYHFYRGGSTLKDLENFPVEKILTVHYCDAPKQWTDPKGGRDCWERSLPGEGVAPIKEITDILKSKGYSGYYTLEVLNYELWGKDPGEVARIGKKAMEDLLGENK